STEMQKVKRWMAGAFAKTSLVAMTDHQALLKNLPSLKLPGKGAAAEPPQTLHGQWKNLDRKYQLTFSGAGKEQEFSAAIEGDRLSVNGEGMGLVFVRED